MRHGRPGTPSDARILLLAVDWADLHPTESLLPAPVARTGWFGDRPVGVAGEGTPQVTEFCVAELAAALGMPTELGGSLLAEALELRHRLPRLWAKVQAGVVPAWRARRVARQTIGLTQAAAAFVDEQVASFAHRIGPAAVDRLVEEALARFDPDDLDARRRQAARHRHVTVDLREVSGAGTVQLYGELDLADGLDLDHVLTQRAGQLTALGSVDTLDGRRATALGELARGIHPIALATESPAAGAGAPTRELVLHVHLSATALTDTTNGAELARVENPRSFVTAEQVRAWCGAAGTSLTVRPVLDLAGQIQVDAYEAPDRLADQVRLRDGTCVFPWCRRSARRCDLDHLRPYAGGGPPGQTSTANLAALCRRHHRLKTFGGWTYSRTGPASYLWTSPHGHRYRRDPTGTQPATESDIPDT